MDSSSSSSSPFGVHCTGSEEGGDGIGSGKAEELSGDLIVEILVRLPVKTLLRFKSVSKLWYSLITSPNFIALHSYRKKKVSLLFLQMVDRGREATVSFRFDQFVEDLTIPFREADVEIVGCFNGVVCLSVSYHPQRYALWNPATRQLREIEIPKEMAQVRRWSCNGFWSGNGFCFDPVANSFTVANISLTWAIGGGGIEETRAHIIQFSTATNSWTQKSMGVPFRIWETGKSRTFVCSSISCVNRYMHCRVVIFRELNGTIADYMYILSYDMIGGIFERIEMPFPLICHIAQLANCSGSLTLFAEDGDVWVMNDCGGADQLWSKLVTCKRPSKVGPGVEVFIESNDELVIVRGPRLSVLLGRCYPYSESLAALY